MSRTTASGREYWASQNEDLAEWNNEYVLRRELSMSREEYETMGPFKREFWFALMAAENDKIKKEQDKYMKRLKK